ncbi:MAG: NlpC/P60 family protein [Bacteroidota bacterium]|jgi:hypothetical protein
MKNAYCMVSIAPVRSEASDRAEIVTQLLFGEVVSIEHADKPWAKIKTYSDNYEGFVDIKHLRPLSPKEVNRWLDGISYLPDLVQEIETPWGKQLIFKGSFIPYNTSGEFMIGNDLFTIKDPANHTLKRDPFELASEYLNAPYLWGGKTPFGIDCSGLTQMVFRFLDINLPRDASQQVEYGRTVPFQSTESGDVAFFQNINGRIIHVGILNGQGAIIHASGMVRIDQLTEEGIVHSNSGALTHNLSCIRRM